MQSRMCALIAVVGALLTASMAAAHDKPVEFGVQASVGDNDLDVGIGARVITDFDALGDHFNFIGTFDYFFPGGGLTYWELNGNAVYVFTPRHSSLRPYLGGGLNLGYASGPGGSASKLGLNVVGGINFRGQSLKPFVETKVVVRNGGHFVVSAGFRF